MAGAGFKTFGVGDVLTASDVNTYLMQQAVMNFADSGARGSAIGTAVLSEGMVSYLADTDSVEVYDGSAWTAVGSPGIGANVVSTTKTDLFSTNSTSFTAVTDLTAAFTPTSATAKVLILVKLPLNTSANAIAAARLMRDATPIGIGDAAGSRLQATSALSTLTNLANDQAIIFLDSPATTSEVTYSVEVRVSSGDVRVNSAADDGNTANNVRLLASITAIEVAA